MCEFCKDLEEWEECDRKCISERELSKIDGETYVGLDMSVNPKDCTIEAFCVLENRTIRPISKDFTIKIAYCPMCGRKLVKE